MPQKHKAAQRPTISQTRATAHTDVVDPGDSLRTEEATCLPLESYSSPGLLNAADSNASPCTVQPLLEAAPPPYSDKDKQGGQCAPTAASLSSSSPRANIFLSASMMKLSGLKPTDGKGGSQRQSSPSCSSEASSYLANKSSTRQCVSKITGKLASSFPQNHTPAIPLDGVSPAHEDIVYDPQRHAEYRQRWSGVALGATSGFMFLLVVAIGYALYSLIQPYKLSVCTGALLSIVLHPSSRVRSSLHRGACITRMERMQRRWMDHGAVYSVLGSWMSLWHFSSYVIMRVVFFLGMNKIEWRVQVPHPVIESDGDKCEVERNGGQSVGFAFKVENSKDCGTGDDNVVTPISSPSTVHDCAKFSVEPCPVRTQHGKPRSVFHSALRKKRMKGEEVKREEATVGQHEASTPLTPSSAQRYQPQSTKVRTVAQRQRMVATVRGRWLLRLLTCVSVTFLSHMMLGIQYFALLHATLFLLFLLLVPFLRVDTFVTGASRLWFTALVVFFVCGLSLNFAKDIFTISEAVRRTTSAVVKGGVQTTLNASGQSMMLGASEVDSSLQQGRKTTLDGSHNSSATFHASLASASNFFELQNIQSFIISSANTLVLRELSNILNQTNMTEMALGMLAMFAPDGGASFAGRDTSTMVRSPTGTDVLSSLPNSTLLLWPRWLYSKVFSLGQSKHLANGHGAMNNKGAIDPHNTVDWVALAKYLSSHLLPYVEYALRMLVHLGANLLNFFDSIYALMLFVLIFRYLSQLDHTILFYVIAKMLNVVEPELGSHHARNIERDITVSFVTLLLSFWHLAWFHFSITFCALSFWNFPTPFLFGTVSVILSLFPLVPKWLNPCAIALCATLIRAGTSADEGFLSGLLSFQAQTLLVAAFLEYSDEWLLCVSRGLGGNYALDMGGREWEQLQSFVVGTAVVLGFVAWGTRGIVLGPLTVIIAKVVFDNWDIVLLSGTRHRVRHCNTHQRRPNCRRVVISAKA